MSRLLPRIIPDREPITEAEARRIGASAQAIATLRHAMAHGKAGSITVTFAPVTYGSTPQQTIALYRDDMLACLALLIEREAAFLTSFNVKLDTPAK